MSIASERFKKLTEIEGVEMIDIPLILGQDLKPGLFLWSNKEKEREVLYLTRYRNCQGFISFEVVKKDIGEKAVVSVASSGIDLGSLLRLKLAANEFEGILNDEDDRINLIIGYIETVILPGRTKRSQKIRFDGIVQRARLYDLHLPIELEVNEDFGYRKLTFSTVLGKAKLICFDDQTTNPGVILDYDDPRLKSFIGAISTEETKPIDIFLDCAVFETIEQQMGKIINYIGQYERSQE